MDVNEMTTIQKDTTQFLDDKVKEEEAKMKSKGKKAVVPKKKTAKK